MTLRERFSIGIAGRLEQSVRRVRAFLPTKHPGTPGWMLEANRAVEELRQLNSSTEADFLAVGEKLMGFLSSARQVRAEIVRLAEYISGGAGERACNALSAVLRRSAEMQKRVEEASHPLKALRHTAGQIESHFAGFHDVVLSFHVVATLGRIETARLGSYHANVGHLSDEVQACTGSIQGRVEQALQEAAGVEQSIGLEIERVSERDTRQLEALPALVATVEKGLEAFRLRQRNAAQCSVNLAGQFGSFSEALNSVVSAIQFHDITRQRIEHAIESLEQLAGDSQEHTSGPSTEDATVIELQCRQLLGAGDAFAVSVRQVKQELEQIAVRGAAMEGETTVLLGLAADDSQTSFFEEMERCFEGVLAEVSSAGALHRETTAAMVELQHAIARLQACTRDIRAVCQDIHHLAINATIEAVHLGPVGEPLSVVAGAMQTLHADAESRSGQTEESLAALGAAVRSLIPEEAIPQEAIPEEAHGLLSPGPSASDTMIDELRTTIGQLHDSSERSQASSANISRAAAELCADVRAASHGFTVGGRFEETLNRCCRTLERTTAESHPQGVGGAGLEHLTARYTMLSEREIHRVVAEPVNTGPSEADESAVAAGVTPGDLGDNVELF